MENTGFFFFSSVRLLIFSSGLAPAPNAGIDVYWQGCFQSLLNSNEYREWNLQKVQYIFYFEAE